MTKDEYVYKKAKFYYEMFLQNKLVRKVSAVIKSGDKFLVIIFDNKRAAFIGGSVEINETTKHALVREVLEEASAKVTKFKYLTKCYYNANYKFEDKEFCNKRVRYYYLCEIESDDVHLQGLEGEFDKNTKLKWCTLKELKNFNNFNKEFQLIKNLIK